MRLILAAILAALLPLAASAATPRTAVLEVRNMTCALCPLTVRKALERVPGVSQARIDYAARTATVTFDADKTHEAELTRATADAGFPSTVRK